jgi:hypothetical protein
LEERAAKIDKCGARQLTVKEKTGEVITVVTTKE